MKSSHLISIIIPAYNAEETLYRCVKSVTGQSYKNIEIIIVNDCSTDNTGAIISSLANQDNRIIPLSHKENMGSSVARNTALQRARGEYIIFLDADDILIPGGIAYALKAAIYYNADYVDSLELVKLHDSEIEKKHDLDAPELAIPHNPKFPIIEKFLCIEGFLIRKRIYNSIKNLTFTEHRLPKRTRAYGNIEMSPEIIDKYYYIKGKLLHHSLTDNLLFAEELRSYEDLHYDMMLKIKLKNYVMLRRPIYIYHQNINSIVNRQGMQHFLYITTIRKIKPLFKDKNSTIKFKVWKMLAINLAFTILIKLRKKDKPTGLLLYIFFYILAHLNKVT